MSSPSVRSVTLLAALFIAALPSNTHAQQRAVDERGTAVRDSVAMQTAAVNDSSVVTPTTGPRIAPVGVVIHPKASSRDFTPADDVAGINAGSNVAMMGVGVAGIIAGSLVGGDSGTIIAVGGAFIGLVGLYRFLR
jgi:hypothetical protein